MGWLRRTFLTGIIVTVPLIVTIVTLVWIFQFVDAIATPVSTRLLQTSSSGHPRARSSDPTWLPAGWTRGSNSNRSQETHRSQR